MSGQRMGGQRILTVPLAPSLQGRTSEVTSDAMLARARAAVVDLKARLRPSTVRRVPCAYTGEKVFSRDSSSMMLDVDQNGRSSAAVNYLVRSGATYQIPVLVGGAGFFEAHKINVSIVQRLFLGAPTFLQAIEMPVGPLVNAQPVDRPWTTKFSLYPTQGNIIKDRFGTKFGMPGINFMWNVLESSTLMPLASDWMPMSALMPRTLFWPHAADHNVADFNICDDGDGGYKFPCAWKVKQGAFFIFQFRPVTDMFQYDSSVDLSMALGYDDREGGVRDQHVTVRVEVHGERLMGDA